MCTLNNVQLDALSEKMLIELEKRLEHKYHLYRFTNGAIRVDITGHVLNGLFDLAKVKNNEYYQKYLKYKTKYLCWKKMR